MATILMLGFLLGMRHALEADHVAAVATLASRVGSGRQAMMQGAAWGLGHTMTLFLACSLVLFVDTAVPERVAQLLEALVGLMLVALGGDVLRRMLRDRVHFHVHHHDDGAVHLHAHSHRRPEGANSSARPLEQTAHEQDPHDHVHRRDFPMRALGVGLVHGLAGSAALILLALSSVTSPLQGLAYVALFGLGSVVGMAILSLAISVPLRSARRVTWLNHGLQAAVGGFSIAIGLSLLAGNLLTTT